MKKHCSKYNVARQTTKHNFFEFVEKVLFDGEFWTIFFQLLPLDYGWKTIEKLDPEKNDLLGTFWGYFAFFPWNSTFNVFLLLPFWMWGEKVSFPVLLINLESLNRSSPRAYLPVPYIKNLFKFFPLQKGSHRHDCHHQKFYLYLMKVYFQILQFRSAPLLPDEQNNIQFQSFPLYELCIYHS